MQDQVKVAEIPLFYGLSCDQFISYFSTRIPLMDYLCEESCIHKLPRSFILTVRFIELIKL